MRPVISFLRAWIRSRRVKSHLKAGLGPIVARVWVLVCCANGTDAANRAPRIAMSLVTLLALACSGRGAAPGAPDDAPSARSMPAAPAPSASEMPTEAGAQSDEMDEMEAKQAVNRPGPPTLDAVDWQGAFARQRIDSASLPASARQTIGKAIVPVLLPSNEELLRTVDLYAGEGWYTATMQGDGHQVFVRGTRVSHKAPPAAMEQMNDDDQPVRITRTEGIVTASFSLFGAAYNLEIECDEGTTDPHCSSDEVCTDLVKSLGFAGGTE